MNFELNRSPQRNDASHRFPWDIEERTLPAPDDDFGNLLRIAFSPNSLPGTPAATSERRLTVLRFVGGMVQQFRNRLVVDQFDFDDPAFAVGIRIQHFKVVR